MLDAENYNRFRVSPADPMTIRGEIVEALLKQLAETSGGRLKLAKFDESFENRAIYLAEIGSGPNRVLLWSQMHGDEPTHTAVLLDLVSYLLKFPDEPAASDVLKNCTLLMLPLLNPDGAERNTRNNAQDIDVNRDARRLATPEGRALERAVTTLKPKFGFNLHNQNARTAVGTPPRPAVVSVLAPPIDYHDPQTDQVRAAKQIAGAIVTAIEQDVTGMVSRYDADYMPRCFGESIQSKGVTTVLIEVGGWPEADPSPLVELHFHAQLAALRAIASESYRDIDVAIYNSLPRSNEHALFDLMITSAHLFDAKCKKPFTADLGINFTHGNRLAIGKKPEGRVTEIGDLGVTTGKISIDASRSLVMPGRVVYLPDLTPGRTLNRDMLEPLFAAGVTTVVGRAELADRTALDALDDDLEDLAVNVGYVAMLGSAKMLPAAELLDRMLFAISHGILAIVGDPPEIALRRCLEWFDVPMLKLEQLPTLETSADSFAKLANDTTNHLERLGIDGRRGRIWRDAFADFVFFNWDTARAVDGALEWNRLERVMIAGETTWQMGAHTGSTPGMRLRRR